MPFLLLSALPVFAQQIVSGEKCPGYVALLDPGHVPVIHAGANDEALVHHAARFFQQDVEAVTGRRVEIVNRIPATARTAVILGTPEGSECIQKLARDKKIDLSGIKGRWDAYLIQTVEHPMKSVASALVIAGGNKRGVAYGVFELTKQMGVSPWHWWADVPVKKKPEIHIKSGAQLVDAPKIKYRGIFINDEAPCLTGWSDEKFGGRNHKLYEKVYELLLRLKGNYLWPAMWRDRFFEDDPLNARLADEYGIVMSTSHHEPMMRNANEWKRHGKGEWNYETNGQSFRDYWRKGIERMGGRESIITVGMRGERDRPMTRDGTPTELLTRIINDQRAIISGVTGKPASETPQLWAIYKEVQDYYDKGMQVPDDITLLFCDDNWGNIRRVPRAAEMSRPGGSGVYYHFDFVGGPRSYKWINSNSISRVWEQMHLAYEHNMRTIWIVNVGDIKPMEFPISFFLDYAWAPDKIGADDLTRYAENWAAGQFGGGFGAEIGGILFKHSSYNNRAKPEVLDVGTYSIHHYDEAQRVTREYNDLLAEARRTGGLLPPEYEAAYYELVLHPIEANANLQELYTTIALNRDAAARKDAGANALADKAVRLYANDEAISKKYNSLLGGKWNHMMDQPHIGKGVAFRMLEVQEMPAVDRVPANSTATSPPPANLPQVTSKELIPADAKGPVFYEADGVVSMEAAHYTRAGGAKGAGWTVIPGIGRTGGGLALFPVTARAQSPGKRDALHAGYEFYSSSKGAATLHAYFCPTLNYHNLPQGLQYAVSIDDEAPQIISINKSMNRKTWEKWVADNVIIQTSTHKITAPGRHVLKFWIVNPGIVAQKFVLDFGGMKESRLGPPETLFNSGGMEVP
ncbi:MAG: glycosyl hydrolase 115 family protein [Opitutaceae bacterium]|nr:glycosyl hydrolase 115 family protein [Opitutaceae bacterium]